MTLAFESKQHSEEFTSNLLHLAHLKNPQLIKANSELQFDLDMSTKEMGDQQKILQEIGM